MAVVKDIFVDVNRDKTHWTMNVLDKLRSLADPGDEFREFSRRLITTGYEILGVRIPLLRKLAKEISTVPDVGRAAVIGVESSFDVDEYLREGPGAKPVYFEEVMFYGLVLGARSRKMSLEDVFFGLERVVPLFDNWAHVDVVVSDMKVFLRHRDEVFRRFAHLKNDPGEFTKRTFVILMKDFFMDAEHIDVTLRELVGVPQGQYYVDMALAWALAEALVKHYDRVEPLLRDPVFSRFVHNKAIQKARESYRITPEQKARLNTLKI
jgi:3-methyladenine DNA glycosylase AlkD